jgi:hypothetical protein
MNVEFGTVVSQFLFYLFHIFGIGLCSLLQKMTSGSGLLYLQVGSLGLQYG